MTVAPTADRVSLSQASILDKLGRGETLGQHELAYLTAVLLEREVTRKQERPYYSEEFHEYIQASGTTDATTGNLMIDIFEVPKGWEAHVTDVVVDVPGSASITPSAPFANAASYAYLTLIPKGMKGTATAANAASAQIRDGMIAFAPSSAGGPILPGQWTFNEANAMTVSDQFIVYLALVGGSVAAILSQSVQVTARIDRFKRAAS